MATISIPNASALASPIATASTSGSGVTVETLESGNTSIDVDISSFSTLAYPNYSAAGGGSIRPTSGQVYPRGT